MKSLFVTIPHSGERVPEETPWLVGLDEVVLMRDVDRYVDLLYSPGLKDLDIEYVNFDWHRYAVDPNRFPEDVDEDSVSGHQNPSGKFNRGLHWVVTTLGEPLIHVPMQMDTHNQIVEKYYNPFHKKIEELFLKREKKGLKDIYHIDAHSMPSVGTDLHRDPGETRAEVVISDCKGKSCSEEFKNLVVKAYSEVGFEVKTNWPYFGGRITERYGAPDKGRHSIQVELNRSLYMNEDTKQLENPKSQVVQDKIKKALKIISDKIG